MRSILLSALVVAAILTCGKAEERTQDKSEDIALRIAHLIADHDTNAAAALLHYPSTYSTQERDHDSEEVAKSLSFLLEEFGDISELSRHLKSAVFFEIGVGGGDIPYWESLSPLNITDYLYSANFAKLGPGFLRIRIFRHPTLPGPAVRSIDFALPAMRGDTKAKLISIMKRFFEFKGQQLPPDIDEILERSLKALKSNKPTMPQPPPRARAREGVAGSPSLCSGPLQGAVMAL